MDNRRIAEERAKVENWDPTVELVLSVMGYMDPINRGILLLLIEEEYQTERLTLLQKRLDSLVARKGV